MAKKATLEFNLEDEFGREELNDALNGSKYRCQIDDIWMQVFRPYRKHGYPDQHINEILEKMGEDGDKLMEYLIGRYFEAIDDD
jgi:hypothetical protein